EPNIRLKVAEPHRETMPEDTSNLELSPQSPEEWVAAVRRCEREGELFRAYDLARQGLASFPDDLRLKHRAVLCLASTGARQQASQLFGELGLAGHGDIWLTTSLGLDIAALRPRLLKDEALAA